MRSRSRALPDGASVNGARKLLRTAWISGTSAATKSKGRQRRSGAHMTPSADSTARAPITRYHSGRSDIDQMVLGRG